MLELDKTDGQSPRLVCAECKNRTNHKVLRSVRHSGGGAIGNSEDSYWWEADYQIVQCLGCETCSFRSVSSNSEEYDEDGPAEFESIFPKRSLEGHATKDYFNVPWNLRRVYRESIDSFNNGNLILCAAGVRALVEGLCKVHGVTDGPVETKKADGAESVKRQRDLQGKIHGLHEKGILTQRSANMLHEHRFLGNTSLHELTQPKPEDLLLAIQIIENVLDSLYEMPSMAERLKNRRNPGSAFP